MEKLIKALEDKFPGCEVIDAKFTTAVNKESTHSVAEFDALLADAIENAVEMDISTLF